MNSPDQVARVHSPVRDPYEWAKALEERGIIVAPREGAIRFSPHAGNDEDEIARVLETIDALERSRDGSGAATL